MAGDDRAPDQEDAGDGADDVDVDGDRDFEAGFGRWSDEQADRVREARRAYKEKSKARMRRRAEGEYVRVPADLLEEIDAEYERRGYTSREAAIRDALRDWLNPTVTLSEETLADLEVSREQIERGETVPLEDVRDRLDEDG